MVDDFIDQLDLALAASGCDKVKYRPRLLSDNGPCCVASDLGGPGFCLTGADVGYLTET
jgi:hypothetical protein